MIRMPEYVTESDVDKGTATAFARKKLELVKDIELYQMAEGKCVQMLHIDPFSTEPETLEKMNHLIEKNGLYHEIYLSVSPSTNRPVVEAMTIPSCCKDRLSQIWFV